MFVCGEAFWGIRGGDVSVESNRSGFAELYQMRLATFFLFLEQNWTPSSLIFWLMQRLVCQIIQQIHISATETEEQQ